MVVVGKPIGFENMGVIEEAEEFHWLEDCPSVTCPDMTPSERPCSTPDTPPCCTYCNDWISASYMEVCDLVCGWRRICYGLLLCVTEKDLHCLFQGYVFCAILCM